MSTSPSILQSRNDDQASRVASILKPSPQMYQPPEAQDAQAAAAPPAHQGFWGKLGSALTKAAPYFEPVAAHLAAAAGNYNPLINMQNQRQRQFENQRESALTQNTLNTGAQERQFRQLGIDNYESPAQQRAAQVTQAGQLEDVRNLHAPEKDIVTPGEGGGAVYVENVYDPATGQRVTRPKMQTTQVPNPALAPYQSPDSAAKPNYVQDWPAGAPPTMPKTVPQQSQLRALPKTAGAPQTEPTKILRTARRECRESEISKARSARCNTTAPLCRALAGRWCSQLVSVGPSKCMTMQSR
jgi:hypothetical protein